MDDPVSRVDPTGLWSKTNFDESKVSRDNLGQFASTPGGGAGSGSGGANTATAPQSDSGWLVADAGTTATDAPGWLVAANSGKKSGQAGSESKPKTADKPNDTGPFLIEDYPREERQRLYEDMNRRGAYDLDAMSREIAAMTPREKAYTIGLLGEKHPDREAASRMTEGDKRQILLLSGTPPEVVRQVLSDSRTDYDTLRKSGISLDMLPPSMREETLAMQNKVQFWGSFHGSKLDGAMQRWVNVGENASPAMKEESAKAAITETFAVLQPMLEDAGITIRWENVAGGNNAMHYSSGEKCLYVNLGNDFFQGRSPERFCDMVGTVIHEVMVHARQTKRMREVLGNKREHLFSDPLMMNGQAYIPFGEGHDKAYILQPIELQAHLVHNVMRESLMKRFRSK